MEDDLSEGEIVSSNSENEVPVGLQPSTAKKPKVTDESSGAAGSSEVLSTDPLPSLVSPEQPLSRKEKRKLKKRRKKSSVKKSVTRPARMAVSADASSSALRKRKVREIIGLLAGLSQGQGSTSSDLSPSLLKTVWFQSIVLQLVTRPTIGMGLEAEKLRSLRESRIVIVWLSLVSAEFFNSSSGEHFKKVKSLHPCVRFLIEHPGSNRFVKLGLEAFLLRQEKDADQQSEALEGIDGQKFNRASCLLSLLEMEENGFPLPHSDTQRGTETGRGLSEYLQVADWSEREANVRGTDMSSFSMFAIDCEMVETSNGLELARVSVVNESLDCVYDSLVKPELPVVDYKTQFSGIDGEMLAPVTTSLRDVHPELSKILPSRCILVGHSLENDLHALKLSHPYVIDTSCTFTPNSSPLCKPSLRLVAKKLLGADIQSESSGHCSIEDATTCMKLIQKKVREGRDCTIPWNDGCRSILADAVSYRRTSAIIDKQGVVSLFGRECTHRCVTDSDDEVIREAKSLLPETDFTFLQLHAMENFLKSPEREDGGKLASVVNSLDSNVISLIEDCPAKTLVFVVCGSSDIREVKQLHQQRLIDFDRLKAATTIARTGLVLALHVN